MGRFSAQVTGFVRESRRNYDLIVNRSIDLVVKNMLAETTVVTGNLRRSLKASTLSMPKFKPGVKFREQPAERIALVIAGRKGGKPFYFGFTAAYAARWNYGFTGTDKLGRSYNQSGSGMVQRVAARWPAFVRQADRELGE